MLDDDTLPDLDPDATLSQFYLCRFTRWGCRYGVRYWPGGRDEAHSVIRLHERQCIYRFGPD